jgi:hypothetical protein
MRTTWPRLCCRSQRLEVRRRIEPERPKAGDGFAAPPRAETEQAIELVEMHAVTVGEVQRREPADRLIAPSALPLRNAGAVATVPFVQKLTPGEVSGLSSRSNAGQLPVDGSDDVVTAPPCRSGLMRAGVRRRLSRDERSHHFGLVPDEQSGDGFGTLRAHGSRAARQAGEQGGRGCPSSIRRCRRQSDVAAAHHHTGKPGRPWRLAIFGRGPETADGFPAYRRQTRSGRRVFRPPHRAACPSP